MKELITNKKLNAKLQKSLELIKEANEMLEFQKNEIINKDKRISELTEKLDTQYRAEVKNLKSDWKDKFSNWTKDVYKII